MKTKIYPEVSRDTSIKFLFDDNDKHYTIRFAGNPSLLVEQLYREEGGTSFLDSYYKFINNEDDIEEKEKKMIANAITQSKKFINALDKIGLMGRSPFVVYSEDYCG